MQTWSVRENPSAPAGSSSVFYMQPGSLLFALSSSQCNKLICVASVGRKICCFEDLSVCRLLWHVWASCTSIRWSRDERRAPRMTNVLLERRGGCAGSVWQAVMCSSNLMGDDMGDSWAVWCCWMCSSKHPCGCFFPESLGILHFSYLNHVLLPVKGTALILLGFYLVLVIALPWLRLLDGWIFKRVA